MIKMHYIITILLVTSSTNGIPALDNNSIRQERLLLARPCVLLMKRGRPRSTQLQCIETIPQVNDTTFEELKSQLLELDQRIAVLGKKILPKGYAMKFESPYLAISKITDKKLSADDARVLVSTALQGNVHRQYAQAFGGYYIVTTCRDRSFYGKNVDTSKKNGIVIIRLKRIFIIARYDVPETSFEFIPTLELFADKLAEFGY